MKQSFFISFIVFQLFWSVNSYGEDVLKSSYLNDAEKLLQPLIHRTSQPIRLIRLQKDLTVWLGWKPITTSSKIDLATLKLVKGDTIVFDFGRNMVGYLQGETQTKASIKLETAEVLAELGDSWEQYPAIFENGYKPGKFWSPFILEVNNNWQLNKRLTFRYVRIIVLDSASELQFSDFSCDEVSAIAFKNLKCLKGFSAEMAQIDMVSQYTLRNCIQEVFEDGPKRDQRLWLGDLRLQALTNGLTFKSNTLVKRSLLLFAGSQRKDGFVPACVFTNKGRNPEIGDEMIPDYAMLFGSVLLDYATNANDWELAKKLYPLASEQLDIVCNKWLNSKDILEIPENVWQFIDWSKNLDRQAAEQATAIYSIKSLLKLAHKLGLKSEVAKWENLSKRMTESAIDNLYDKEKGLFISGKQKQVSYASQIWMILAGVVDKNTGIQILNRVKADSASINPGTPYLMHHLVQAYLLCGMDKEAYQIIESYWGGMIDKGADTFWEIYDPENAYKSPYNSHLFNSYCHAWSCTPAWFLRHPQYGKRLQRIDKLQTHVSF